MDDNLETTSSRGWFWIKNNQSTQNRSDIKGKYLFFSDDKEELIELAKVLLEKHDLAIAKTPSSDVPNESEGFGFVLCVYDSENRHCKELKESETDTISFRYWKSDDATRAGSYSKQYMDSKKK